MIVLVGFMGAGKSTVGRLLAERLGVGFLDSDAVLAGEAGQSIPEIFDVRGEDGFRQLEAETIRRLLAGPEAVLAVGGGALSRADVRAALAGHRVVLLDVSLAGALARVASDPDRPMLRSPDLPGLYAGRQDAYRRAATVVVPVDGRSPREVVEHVLTALGKVDVGE